MAFWWKQPLAGDIVWCHFPQELQTKPAEKPRPALVLTVFDDRAPEFSVVVAYGTSQKVTLLYAGEFVIGRTDGAAFRAAGLSYDTKFDLTRRLELYFNDAYFSVPPGAPHGEQPKVGMLHPSLMRRAAAAFRASATNIRN